MALRRSRRSGLDRGAEVVRRLAEVEVATDRGLDGLSTQVLRAGCDLLGLEIGVVAEIEGRSFRVLSVEGPPDVGLEAGMTLELDRTFSSLIVEADGPVGLRSTRGKGLASHPAHETMAYGSYLGVPLRVAGTVAGSLSFAGREPRRHDFTRVQVDVAELLAARLSSELERRRLEHRLSEAYRQLTDGKRELERLATQDATTGLLNRRTIVARLAHERNRADREGRPVGLFLMNVDRLREINGNFGYETGDRVLAEIAQRVAGSLRGYDHLGRFSADEFLAILPGCSLQQAAEIAERAREAVADSPFATGDDVLTVTGSFGVTSSDDHQLTIDALLGFADKALYLAKQGGRNCIKVTASMEMASP